MGEVADRIVIDNEILGGKPVIKGARIPVYLIVELLENNLTATEILHEYPALKEEDIKAAIFYSKKCMKKTNRKKGIT
jgi:uncharacterized protein (DUF433 family)